MNPLRYAYLSFFKDRSTNSVVEYLGRYTHKVAISNHRITDIDKVNDTITFKYKDYKSNGRKQELMLNSMEFIRRFSLHILPKSFVRIMIGFSFFIIFKVTLI